VADEFHWWQAILAGLGGGSIVKAVDIIYLEVRRRLEGSTTATRFVDEHLDPLLKATDELVGKLLALGKEDFLSLRGLEANAQPADSNELGGLLFLFARFWAQIEIIKREGLSVAISQDERGRRLENFLDCLESTRVRLVDRTAHARWAKPYWKHSMGSSKPLRTLSSSAGRPSSKLRVGSNRSELPWCGHGIRRSDKGSSNTESCYTPLSIPWIKIT
jgi:hypothetical protein